MVKSFALRVSILCLALGFAGVARAATYEVPVSDPSLKPYAIFNLPTVKRKITWDGKVEVKYPLPEALTGAKNVVTFTGTPTAGSASLILTGPNGTMNCVQNRCSVRFQNLKIDQPQLERTLTLMSANQNEFQKRLIVAHMIGGDPGGILTY